MSAESGDTIAPCFCMFLVGKRHEVMRYCKSNVHDSARPVGHARQDHLEFYAAIRGLPKQAGTAGPPDGLTDRGPKGRGRCLTMSHHVSLDNT